MARQLSIRLVLLGFIIACGSSGDNSGGGGGPELIQVGGFVDITGDLTATGAFTAPGHTAQPSCAAFASEGASSDDPWAEGTFAIPGPPFNVPLEPSGDVYAAALRIPAEEYNGPGTYVNDGATIQIRGQIVLVEVPDGPTYFPEDGTATATVMADGSGSLTFEDLPQNGGQETQISGTVTWTCSDP